MGHGDSIGEERGSFVVSYSKLERRRNANTLDRLMSVDMLCGS